MTYSMTGFAALEKEVEHGVLVIELRSVNHRYLELQLKVDDQLRSAESMIRELISSKLGRGKVECRINFMRRSKANDGLVLDQQLLSQLAAAASGLQGQFPQSQPLSIADILRWPGVITAEQGAQDALFEAVKEGLLQALDDMSKSRLREGEKLKEIILQRLADIEGWVAKVKPLLPQQMKAYQERLLAKLQETLKTVDEERIRQELVIFAQRMDVDEELSRLTAHVSEVKRILNADAAAGKRLDFLMQELNREANTLGSKSVSTEVTQVSMELKVLIEQIREQVQNIE